MIKKIALATMCLAVLAGAAFAGGGSDKSSKETIVLKMGDNIPDRTTGWGVVIEKINTDFKAMHPNVQIVTESYQDQAWQE